MYLYACKLFQPSIKDDVSINILSSNFSILALKLLTAGTITLGAMTTLAQADTGDETLEPGDEKQEAGIGEGVLAGGAAIGSLVGPLGAAGGAAAAAGAIVTAGACCCGGVDG